MNGISNCWQAFAMYHQQAGTIGEMNYQHQDPHLAKSNLHIVLEEGLQTEPVILEELQVMNLENVTEIHMGQREKTLWQKEGSAI
jgi:hypothetical protein